MYQKANTTARANSISIVSFYMRQVYQWMTVGLTITAGVAWFVAHTPALANVIIGNTIVLIALIVAQFGLVIAISSAVQRMSSATATGCFVLYSALTGATLSTIFIIYPMGSIANAFIVTAGTFLAMSIYGAVTKRDLTAMGSFLMMGLFGIIIAMVVNIFLQSSMLDFIISCVGVLVFTGLTAYDTQKLREFGANTPIDNPTAMRRGVILGALTLYLDFINLFLMMLRLFSGSRN